MELFLKRDISTGDWQEWEIQAYIIQEARRAGYFIEGDQNAAKRSRGAGARAKACGMNAGSPDMRVLLFGGRTLWAELKKRKGIVSQKQKDWHKAVAGMGHEVRIIWADTPLQGWQEMKHILKEKENGNY